MPDFNLTPVDYDPFANESGDDWAARLKASPGYDPATDSARIPEGPSASMPGPGASMPPLPPTRPPQQQIQDITQRAQLEQQRFPTPSPEEQIRAIAGAATANPVFSMAERAAGGEPQPPLTDDPADMDRYLEAQKRYYGGNFMDVLGLAAPQMARPEENAAGIFGSKPMQAYHGSPHDFDEFQTSKIGTGQGAQSYGHGLYFAENRDVAQNYKDTLSPLGLRDRTGNDVPLRVGDQSLLKELNSFDGNHDALIKAYQDSLGNARYPEYLNLDAQQKIQTLLRWKAQGATPQPIGKMYQVDINEDPAKFIDLDKSWSEQPQEVRDLIRSMGSGLKDTANPAMDMHGVLHDLGDDIRYKKTKELMSAYERGELAPDQHRDLRAQLANTEDKVLVANAMRDAGVPGFKYLDEKSRRDMSPEQIDREIEFKKQGIDFYTNNPEAMGSPRREQTLKLLQGDLDRLEELKRTPQTQNAVVFNDKNIKIRSKLGALGSGEEDQTAAPAGWISQRVPTEPNWKNENPHTTPLMIDKEVSMRDPKLADHNVDLIKNYDSAQHYYKPGMSTDEATESYINFLKDNLVWAYNDIGKQPWGKEVLPRSMLWYDGGNHIVTQRASQYGISNPQSAGVYAALSPQMEWNNNVSLGDRLLDIGMHHYDTPFQPEMLNTAQRIFKTTEADYKNFFKTALKRNGGDEKAAQSIALQKVADKQKQFDDQIERLRSGTLESMPTAKDKGAWIRAFDETYGTRDFQIISPEGHYGKIATNDDGSHTLAKWQTQPMIANAVNALWSRGDIPTISAAMGDRHKVRNFYGNLLHPNSPLREVTIDTHAVAADHFQPFGGSDDEVMHNLDTGGGSKGSDISGVRGTYGLHAEAYRRAADALGILPRQLQSVTWEGVRNLFDGFKSKGSKQIVEQIWRDPNRTIQQKREAIRDAAGGWKPPAWYQGSAR